MIEFYELMLEKNNYKLNLDDLKYEFNHISKFENLNWNQMKINKGPLFRTKMIGKTDYKLNSDDIYYEKLLPYNKDKYILEWSWELVNYEESDLFKNLGFGTNLLSLILKDIIDRRFNKKSSSLRRKRYRNIVQKAT